MSKSPSFVSHVSIISQLASFLISDVADVCNLSYLSREAWHHLLSDQSVGQLNHEQFWKVLFELKYPSSFVATCHRSTPISSCSSQEKEAEKEEKIEEIEEKEKDGVSSGRGSGDYRWKQLFIDRYLYDVTSVKRGLMRKIVLESHATGVSTVCSVDIVSNQVVGLADTRRPTVLTGDEQGTIMQWDPMTGLILKAIDSIHESKIVSIVSCDSEAQSLSNRVVSCESGRLDCNGDGARVVIWDAFKGSDTVYETVEHVNCAVPSDDDDGMESEPVGEVKSFLWLNESCFVCAAASDLFIWHKSDSGSGKFSLLHHISNAHDSQISVMKKVHGFTGGSSDPANDGDNGLVIVTGSLDGTIHVWNVHSGKRMYSVLAHEGSVSDLDTSATGYIVSASTDATAKVWKIDDQLQCIATLSGHTKPVTCVMVDKNAKRTSRIVTGSLDRTVRVWDRQSTGSGDEFICTSVLKDHAAKISSLCFNDSLIMTGSTDRSIYLYDAHMKSSDDPESLRLLSSSSVHLGNISTIVFDDLGRFSFAGSADGAISIFNHVPTRRHVVQCHTGSQEKNGWISPVYDTSTNTYMGPPTPTWQSRVTETLPSDAKPIKVVPILENLHKDVLLLYNVLSPSECESLIKETESLQYEDCHGYHVQYRSNKRVIIMDFKMCDVVSDRIRQFVPQSVIRNGYEWHLTGLNEVWRFCRYTPSQHFSPHLDGYFARNDENRSFFTFMIYMNGGFEAGATRFLKDRQSLEVLESVVPTTGMTLVFPHDILHDGEPLGSGVKYIMRSDVMYRRGKPVSDE